MVRLVWEIYEKRKIHCLT